MKTAAGTRAARPPPPQGCPLWSRCPRHHGARDLVTAQVWVATPASLVHSAVPPHQTDARIRYLELACRMSDLIIVDEADRVQMQLDAVFAPSATLVGKSPDSWLDEVQAHKITEFARQGRLQLSAQEIDDWASAVNTVYVAADRLYALLTQNQPLRNWVIADYFSPFTLHQRLLSGWFPEIRQGRGRRPGDGEPEISAPLSAERDRVSAILDAVRDDPLQPRAGQHRATPGTSAADLVRLTLELLHATPATSTRARLRRRAAGPAARGVRDRIAADLDAHVLRFEFTLILAALHHRLDYVTGMWPVVEAALNLDFTSNVLSRRPPRDYEPFIPESPMGNVLGFQFQLDEGGQSGSLRFFRCSGVGRELLLGLHAMPAIDGRPGPNVLLMSATSWAGTSSRYHVHVPVGAILRPQEKEVKAILGTTFRMEFLYGPDGQALRLSGAGARPAGPACSGRCSASSPSRTGPSTGATSKLADELADIATDPDRRRILLLTGSYAEAQDAADYLNGLPEWAGRVTALISDDADFDDAWAALPGEPGGGPAAPRRRRLVRRDHQRDPGGPAARRRARAQHRAARRQGRHRHRLLPRPPAPPPRRHHPRHPVRQRLGRPLRPRRRLRPAGAGRRLAGRRGPGVPRPRPAEMAALPHAAAVVDQPAAGREAVRHLGPARRHVAGHRPPGPRRRPGARRVRGRRVRPARGRADRRRHPGHQPPAQHAAGPRPLLHQRLRGRRDRPVPRPEPLRTPLPGPRRPRLSARRNTA